MRNEMLTKSHFSGEDESKLILSFRRSSSGKPTMSETGDLGDFEHSAPGERGDLEKSAPPGERGDFGLDDLWAGIGLGWPGIGLPAPPTESSSLDCCQHTWIDIYNFMGIFKHICDCACVIWLQKLNTKWKHIPLHKEKSSSMLQVCFIECVFISQAIELVLLIHLKIISLCMLRASCAFNSCILLISSDLAQNLCLSACDVTCQGLLCWEWCLPHPVKSLGRWHGKTDPQGWEFQPHVCWRMLRHLCSPCKHRVRYRSQRTWKETIDQENCNLKRKSSPLGWMGSTAWLTSMNQHSFSHHKMLYLLHKLKNTLHWYGEGLTQTDQHGQDGRHGRAAPSSLQPNTI